MPVMNWKLIRDLTFSQMKARYRRTLAGFVWVVLSPIIMYGAQAFVFKAILKINVPDYATFLLGGLLPWIFLVSSLEMGIPVLQFSRELLVAHKVHPLTLIFSSLLDNWFNFIAAFLLILIPMLLSRSASLAGLILMPLAILQLLAGAGGLLWLLSVLNIFYRDVRFVFHFAIGVAFYLTPVFYPKEFIPESYRILVDLNPLYALIDPVRQCVYSFSLQASLVSLVKGALVATGLVLLSQLYWRRRQNEFYYYL